MATLYVPSCAPISPSAVRWIIGELRSALPGRSPPSIQRRTGTIIQLVGVSRPSSFCRNHSRNLFPVVSLELRQNTCLDQFNRPFTSVFLKKVLTRRNIENYRLLVLVTRTEESISRHKFTICCKEFLRNGRNKGS